MTSPSRIRSATQARTTWWGLPSTGRSRRMEQMCLVAVAPFFQRRTLAGIVRSGSPSKSLSWGRSVPSGFRISRTTYACSPSAAAFHFG